MDPKVVKSIDNRLATMEGHIRAIRRMVAEGKDNTEILTQMLAVEKSAHRVGLLLLNYHVNVVMVEAMEKGDYSDLPALNAWFKNYYME